MKAKSKCPFSMSGGKTIIKNPPQIEGRDREGVLHLIIYIRRKTSKLISR